jgi:hypothetical protein
MQQGINNDGPEMPFLCELTTVQGMEVEYEVNLGPEGGGLYMVNSLVVTDGLSTTGMTSSAVFNVTPGRFVEDACEYGTHPEIVDYDNVDFAIGKEGEGGDRITPYPRVPGFMCERYSMGGRAGVSVWYFDDKSVKGESYKVRSRGYIEDLVERAERREMYYYGDTDGYLYDAMDAFGVEGKTVLIIGSNVPWYESICIARGAGRIVTLEYNEVRRGVKRRVEGNI